MKYAIETPSVFRREAEKFFRQHPDLESRFETVVTTRAENPFEPSLRLHPLSGKLEGFHAVRLSHEYRIVLVLRVEDRHITLIDISSHDKVYR